MKQSIMTLAFDIPAAPASALTVWDPRWKLAALMPAALLLALVQTPLPAASAFAGSLALVQLARLSWPWLARRLTWTALFLALFLIWLPFLPDPAGEVIDLDWLRLSLTGLERFAAVLLKTLAVVTLSLILLATAPLYDTLKAAQSLRVPGILVQLVLLSLRYVFLLADEFLRLRTALRVRGYRNRADLHSWRTAGQVAGTLLVRGHERGERVHQAMRCRGFDGTYHTLHDFTATWRDAALAVLVLAAAGGLLAWDLWRR
jgi:cobalt/nickel transport system permease protein